MPQICRRALAYSCEQRLLCADQIEWLTTARVRVIDHRRTLVLQVYSRAGAAQGDLLPKWTVFQQKDDYLTLERREDGTASWRTACFERLSPDWNFVSRCAFLTQSDRKCIIRFFHDGTQDGFGCLTAHQKLIQEDWQKARQRKERRRINARMQSVPPVPRGLKRWLYRKIMPAYFFYDAVKGRKTVPGVCSACGRENLAVRRQVQRERPLPILRPGVDNEIPRPHGKAD